MGLFFRKGFKLGPLRLNLSKSGIGASIGVKGARVGINAKGKTYLAAGRGGLYYRKQFSGVTKATGSVPLAKGVERRSAAGDTAGAFRVMLSILLGALMIGLL